MKLMEMPFVYMSELTLEIRTRAVRNVMFHNGSCLNLGYISVNQVANRLKTYWSM